LKKYSEAEKYFAQSVHTIELSFGKDSYNLSTYLRNLGVTYLEDGNSSKAEETFRRELSIEKKMPGGSVSYTQTTVLLIKVCLDSGRENEIGPVFQKLIEYNRDSAKSEDLLRTAILFVSIRFQKERWEKIAPIYEAALAAARNEHSSARAILPSLAVVVQSAIAHKNFSAAEHYAQTGIELIEQSPTHKQIDLSGPIRELMEVYKAEENWNKAEALAGRQAEIFGKAFGERDSRVANAFDDYSTLAAKAGHLEESKRAREKAQDIRVKAYAPKS
jgi:tetratricopeptide (TPR) repeat protein